MSGHRPWSQIKRQNPDSPERDARIAFYRRTMSNGMTLVQMRESRNTTQTTLAASIGVSQRRISQIEHSGNPNLETLRSYVQALGGELEVRAIFPDQEPIAFTTS